MSLLARVECRAEFKGDQHPVAVCIGGERIPIREILVDVVEGVEQAGQPAERRLTVILADGQELILTRALPDGDWRVFTRAAGS
jgi:hypothetical protein